MLFIDSSAPDFSTEAVFDSGEIKKVSLSDYKGKWIVLFFYPLDFTFVCPTEITQFREHLKEFKDSSAILLGCSIDSVHSHKRWLRDDLGNLGFGLLSDLTHSISRSYGVLNETEGIATRGTFIISPEQKIQYISIHNFDVGRNAKEILRVLNACQSGELCQAGWKKGDHHLKPVK
ncbi:MAG: peroxiredoxin [Bdellovibrionaceae bacterium]|nr:peroxiredoxin [Pseudobdellovibrionaceae bacterium]